ncbi:hypothetical protein ILUMI_15658 [Ignelater luminosus]|uniref:Uncharacterized protein n=1 Tax=Ignelater luminosus TaxID=2038154 RepID=A0A8K0CW14_IGNLU|nr:hypothetical protein ILUMI_15658 [Ignelater luminosus]
MRQGFMFLSGVTTLEEATKEFHITGIWSPNPHVSFDEDFSPAELHNANITAISQQDPSEFLQLSASQQTQQALHLHKTPKLQHLK